jgi:hypothetical protein
MYNFILKGKTTTGLRERIGKAGKSGEKHISKWRTRKKEEEEDQ